MLIAKDHRFRNVASILLIALVVIGVYSQQSQRLTPQVRQTLRFVSAPSLSEAIAGQLPVQPPLYLLAARSLTQVGAPLRAVNLLFFAGLLVWVWLFARRVAPDTNPALPVGTVAIAHFNFPILATATSEMLMTLLAALSLSALLAHLHRPGWRRLASLAVVTAAACATRYMALFWLLPLACIRLLVARDGSLLRRVGDTTAFAAISLAPVGAWMLHAYARTGFLSGRDRFEIRENVYRSGLQGFENLLLTLEQYGKTFFIDFFSTETWASHEVVNNPYRPDFVALIVATLALVVFAYGAWTLRSRLERGSRSFRSILGRLLSSRSEAILLAQAIAVFGGATLLLWTIGNNDRLNTRFLFPSYPFTVLIGFCMYWELRHADGRRVGRLPFQVLCLLFVAVHLFRNLAFLRAS
jgi:hypothetical protein